MISTNCRSLFCWWTLPSSLLTMGNIWSLLALPFLVFKDPHRLCEDFKKCWLWTLDMCTSDSKLVLYFSYPRCLPHCWNQLLFFNTIGSNGFPSFLLYSSHSWNITFIPVSLALRSYLFTAAVSLLMPPSHESRMRPSYLLTDSYADVFPPGLDSCLPCSRHLTEPDRVRIRMDAWIKPCCLWLGILCLSGLPTS